MWPSQLACLLPLKQLQGSLSDNRNRWIYCSLQIRNEQLSNTVRKVQGECGFVLKQASAAAEKQEMLAAQLAKLTSSLEQTEERIKKSMQESKVG